MKYKSILLLTVLIAAFLFVSIAVVTSEDEQKTSTTSTPEDVSPKTEDPNLENEQSFERISEELKSKGKTKTFQAEITQLLSILINSLYSNKDIFLRELISNASDALDKIRFLSLKDNSVLDTNDKLEIKISADKERKIISIRDSGIGMTKKDLESNLGTIAKSGTKSFIQKLQEGKVNPSDSNLIGQFGVGFYSAFLVADKVTVITKNNDDKQYVWQSTADSSYTIVEDPRGDTLGRGTEIILHMKEDGEDYLKDDKLKKLIETYSEFIQFPIFLYETTTETKEVPIENEESKEEEDKKDEDKKEDEKKEDEKKEDEEDVKVEDEKKEEEKKTKTVTETKSEWSRINDNKPIWTRSPVQITKEEYEKFYKVISKDPGQPITQMHFKAEGSVDFRALLYIPEVPPFNMFDFTATSSRIKLYVKRVFITDQLKDAMPRYLNFIVGIVDSEDLPLNISREMLQESRLLKLIKRRLVTKVVSAIRKLSEADKKSRMRKEDEGKDDPEQQKKDMEASGIYKRFYEAYGKNIRLGVTEDSENRQRLLHMLRFHSTKSEFSMTSLEEYVSRMKEGQKKIYYVAGESLEQVRNSPYLEEMRKREIEVLYMTDSIDEYMLQSVTSFDGKDFQSVQKDGLDIDTEEEKKQFEEVKKEFEPLTKALKEMFKDDKKLLRVDISQRINVSPCILIAPQHGYSSNMLRIMKAQTLGTKDYQEMGNFAELRILELNPNHSVVRELNNLAKSNPKDSVLENLGKVLYDTAKLRSGYDINDTGKYADRIFSLMGDGLFSVPSSESKSEENLKDEL